MSAPGLTVTVAPARADDATTIAALPGLGGSTVRTLGATLAAADHVVLVARGYPAGEVLGVAIGVLLYDEAHVVDVAVVEGARRRGVATALLERLDAELRARGAVATTLEVRASNEPALVLYRRLGFVAEGRRRGYYPDGEDAVVMWRREAS